MEADQRLQILVRQVRDLPALPETAMKVMRLTDSVKASAADVARVLSADQAMTARVLKLANSAFYGAVSRISTVTEAVVMLGMRNVRSMTMALSCQDLMARPLPGYALGAGDLWRHSVCCAYAAQSLARRTGYRAAEEAFVGGLLHDIGKVILNVYMKAEFARVTEIMAAERLPFMEAERRVLGFNHAEVGALVLAKWNLPAPLVECVRYHHAPQVQKQPSQLTALVHVADVMCLMMGVGIGSDGLHYTLEEGIMDRLRLTETDFEETAAEVCDALSQSSTLF